MPAPPSASRTGREAATRALIPAAARFPDLPPSTLHTVGLSPAEAALAMAIHRTTLRRWLTLEHLIGRFVKQPMWRLEPAMRAVLLAGTTQLLFMERLPTYAVVDEMVSLARRLVRPKAAGMVNGVLRNISRLVNRVSDEPWRPARTHLPRFSEAGTAGPTTIHLKQPALPDPADLPAHLALATSMPEPLVRSWLDSFGADRTTDLCLHGLKVAPTIVAVEPTFNTTPRPDGFNRPANAPDTDTPHTDPLPYLPHARPGFLLWQSSHDNLSAFLADHPHRRVQDPASAEPVTALRDIPFTTALDYCAGRGTKTRQLAALQPDSRILATDINPDRLDELQQVTGDTLPNITILPIEKAKREQVDLLLLDVPCSNTAVLARRPEARYRLTRKAMLNLQELQRRIIRDALPTLAPTSGTSKPVHILYSTCSIDPAENQQQARWIARQVHGQILHESQTFPAGQGTTYHDGSYHAVIGRS